VSKNETEKLSFHGIEPDPDEPCYMPGGQEMPGPEERQQNIEMAREEAAREKERGRVLREEQSREEAEQHEAWMKDHAAKTVLSPDVVADALFELLADAGIDLNKVAQVKRAGQVRRMAALTAELKGLAKLANADDDGALDADRAGRMRSCVDEINELAALMAPGDGKFGYQ
jgi:hypothetical protein